MDDYIRKKEGLNKDDYIPLFIKTKYHMSDYAKKINNILEKLSQNINSNNKDDLEETKELLLNEKKKKIKKINLCKMFSKLKYCDYEKKFNKQCPYAHNIDELNVTYYPNQWKNLFTKNRKVIDKIINKKGWTNLIKNVVENNIYEVKNLINKNANPCIQDWNGMDSISYAIKNSSIDILTILTTFKNINYNIYIEKLKSNYLIYSIKNSTFDIINLLLKNGSDPNYEKNNLKPSIFYSIKRGDKNIIRLLIDYNSNLNKKDDKNRTVIDYAISINSIDILSILIKHGAKLNPNSKKIINILFMSVRNFDNDLFSALIKKGISLNVENKKLLLFESYLYKNYDLFIRLLKDYDFTNNDDKNSNLDSILINIIENNDMKRLMILNKNCKNLNYNCKSSQGYTPLIISSKNGYLDIVEFLIHKNLNVNLYDKNSDTALIHACRNNNYLVVEILLKSKKIDWDWKNKMNKSCFDYSCNQVLKLLIEAKNRLNIEKIEK